jgi:Ca-activated chloride channel family protein
MRFHTYSKYEGSWLDALNLENLLEHMADFLLDGGFAGGLHFHPYWGFSGADDPNSIESLKEALLRALLESNDLTPEMVSELRGEGEGDPEVQAQIARLLDDLIEKLKDEGYISVDGNDGTQLGPTEDLTKQGADGTGKGTVDEARKASKSVNFDLTQKGMDFLGYRTLKHLMGALGKADLGAHDTSELATGVAAEAASRPYEFGDTMNLDIPATLKNAIEREGLRVPLELDYPDLMVHQTEFQSSCATVLMLDISHSMILYGEDRFTPAKKVALALSHLIRTQYPGDSLKVVTFGDRAEEIPYSQLAKAQVGPFHTNTAEGFQLSRRLLRGQKKEMRQIIMITDGKPSAVTLPDGQVYLNSGGLDQFILNETFRQVAECRKSGILINTFMLARDPYLVQFVQRVSEIAQGKAYFTSTMTLGRSIMMDFLKKKRRQL